jgi:hypothetical protein
MKGLRLSGKDRSGGYEEVGNSGSGGCFTVCLTRMTSVMTSETAQDVGVALRRGSSHVLRLRC